MSVTPLENVRVIDLTQVLAGPFCTQLLSTMGAEVIHIEPPWGGYGTILFRDTPLDMRRRMWATLERNKKNITLNLRSEKGKEIFLELVKKGDVVMDNFGPGVMEKLGLTYDIMREVNPKIIYCALSGYGQTGPWKDRRAYDPCIQASTGVMITTGYADRRPVRAGPAISDCLGGLYAAIGILLALHARDTITGKGQIIDCAMYDASISVLVGEYARGNWSRMGNRYPFAVPSEVYETKDGKLEYISVQADAQWEALMKTVGRQDIAAEKLTVTERVERADEVDNILEAWTGAKTQEEIEKILHEIRVPCAPVLELEEVVKHPHSAAREMFVEVDDMYGKITGVPGVVPKLSDTPGVIKWGLIPSDAFNEELYAGLLGYTKEELSKLKEEEVI
jgi:CoA:oxalate CoA-transferase